MLFLAFGFCDNPCIHLNYMFGFLHLHHDNIPLYHLALHKDPYEMDLGGKGNYCLLLLLHLDNLSLNSREA